MLNENQIVQFIQEDERSSKKKQAKVGFDYYEGRHEILNYKLYYYNQDGELKEDHSRSNVKIPHPFFTELVDQEIQYMLSGKDGFVKSDIPELQTELDNYFNENEDFEAELYDVLIGAVSKGFEYMYAYKNKEDRLAFQCADSMGVVEIRAKDTDDNCDYVIYWYVERLAKYDKKIKKIQVWNDKEVYYYVQEDNGKITLDTSAELNPRPHTIFKKGKNEDVYYENFGFIPFFRLDNCRKQLSALKPIKELIDDYDLMSCGLSNNIQDASEYLVVVKGFGGDMEELMQNVKTKKHIGVKEGGELDYKTVDIPYEARKTKIEHDEKNIYRFGMGFNSAQLGDGNITNVVIKSRYALLDLKCNKLEIRLKQFLRKILKVVLKEINDIYGTDYQQKDVYFTFEREIMTNALDNAQIEQIEANIESARINTLLGLQNVLDNETILKNICDVMDIDFETIKPVENEIEEIEKVEGEIDSIVPEDGDVDE